MEKIKKCKATSQKLWPGNGFELLVAALMMTMIAVTSTAAYALEESDNPYLAEVIGLTGEVTASYKGQKAILAKGQILRQKSVIEVGPGSSVDLTLDAGLKNTIRLKENTKIYMTAIFPTGFYLTHGSVFAQLDELPPNSTFEIETPVSLSAVRGSAFHVAYGGIEGKDHTRISNLHDSTVYFFKKVNQNISKPVKVMSGFTASLQGFGNADQIVREMNIVELEAIQSIQVELGNTLQTLKDQGYQSNIQNMQEVGPDYADKLSQRLQALSEQRVEEGTRNLDTQREKTQSSNLA